MLSANCELPKCQTPLPNSISQSSAAGPAGSSAAITAARLGARVLLLEARDFPRHKVCGEFVSAEALGRTRRTCFGTAHQPGHCSTTAPPLTAPVCCLGTRVRRSASFAAGLSITRYDLDATSVESSSDGQCRDASQLRSAGQCRRWPVPLQTASGDVPATALIVAAGRWSQFSFRPHGSSPVPSGLG